MSDVRSNSGGGPHVETGHSLHKDLLSLSSAQLGIWFAHRLDPTGATYNIGEYLEIDGPVDPALFERALRQVVSAADVLRVEFIEQDGEPRQLVGAPSDWSMPVIDVSAEPDPRAAAEAWMRAEIARPVELTDGPLFCFALFKASATRFYWYARYHHIIMDAFGMWLIASRVADTYTKLCGGRAVDGNGFGSLDELVEVDASYRASAQFARDRQYWNEQLETWPEPGSTGAGSRASARPNGFLRRTTYLPDAVVDDLRSTARRTRTSLARILGAATAVYLHRHDGGEEVIFGLPVAARDEVTERIPGMASNVLPLRLALHSGTTVAEAIAQTSRAMRQALEHHRYQLADLRRDAGSSADDRALFGPSLNVMPFKYDFGFAGHRAIAHNLSLGPVEDISISVYDRSDGAPLRIDFDANSALHSETDLAEFQQRFLRLLKRI